ncbi:MAG TPA: sensor histidine kinase [Promineifilum sp.]|nr:sensor histidine kinase [Promineifilum sp.]
MAKPMAEFFENNLVVIYFFYGLAFFSMGLAIWLTSSRFRTSEFRLAGALLFLAGFGIVHGLQEWFDMFRLLDERGSTIIPYWLLLHEVHLIHLVISFLLLVFFGIKLLFANRRTTINGNHMALLGAGAFLALWMLSVGLTWLVYRPERLVMINAADVLARYTLGMTGSVIAAWAIWLEQRNFKAHGMPQFGRLLLGAAVALLLYGVIGQLFVQPSFFFPSTVINSETFLDVFGFPIQLLRAVLALLMAYFIIRALTAFEIENQRRLADAVEQRAAAQQEALRVQQQARIETEQLNRQLQSLLHRIVSAQEAERKRIARELHDGTGQTLTALGLGLAAAADRIDSDPAAVRRQLTDMKQMNAQVLQEVHNVISDLRPSILDNLGLVPALRGHISAFESRTGIQAQLVVHGKTARLKPEVETTVFRIVQESLTNVMRHAAASSVLVEVTFNETGVELAIRDDGRGFDVARALTGEGGRAAWGLLGIHERASLVGGSAELLSSPGEGTTVRVSIPQPFNEVDHE